MKKNITKNTQLPTVEFVAPGLLRIFAAMVYDMLLLAAISIAYGAIAVGVHVALFGQPASGQRIQWGMSGGIAVTLGWILVLMYFYIYFWQKFGQTLGMKTWRFQVVDANTNQRITQIQALKRSVTAFFSLLIFGMGYWYKFTNSKQRLLHDVASGTKLILLKKE